MNSRKNLWNGQSLERRPYCSYFRNYQSLKLATSIVYSIIVLQTGIQGTITELFFNLLLNK